MCAKAGQTLSGHLAGRGRLRGPPPARELRSGGGGARASGEECEQQSPSERKTVCFPPSSASLNHVSSWQQDRQTHQGLRADSSSDRGAGLAASSFLRLPPERGGPPWGSLHTPSAEGWGSLRGCAGPGDAPFCPQAQRPALAPSASQGLKPPPGSSGCRRAEGPEAERKGPGEGPLCGAQPSLDGTCFSNSGS